MAWSVRLSRRAAKAIRRMGAKDRRLVAGTLEKIEESPLQGDVRRLAGQPSSLKHRAGAWRIFVQIDFAAMIVDVTAIERRTTTTYKKRH